MPVVIQKAIAATTLGTAAAAVQLGGADQKVPEWASWLLGARYCMVGVKPTTQQALHANAYISATDFSPNPSRVLVVGQNGSVATNSLPIHPRNEFWYYNYPLHGGDAYSIYMQPEVANTAAPYGAAEITFADADGMLPSYLDPYPHIPIFWERSGYAASATATQAMAAITITGAKSVRELCGYVLAAATAAQKAVQGYFVVVCNGFFSSPIHLMTEAINGTLGTITGEDTPIVSRIPVIMPTAPTSVITATYMQGTGAAVTTDVANFGVGFSRDI